MRKFNILLAVLLALFFIIGCSRGGMFYKGVKKLYPTSEIEPIIGSESAFIVRDSLGNVYYVKWGGWDELGCPRINQLVLKTKK